MLVAFSFTGEGDCVGPWSSDPFIRQVNVSQGGARETRPNLCGSQSPTLDTVDPLSEYMGLRQQNERENYPISSRKVTSVCKEDRPLPTVLIVVRSTT